MIIGHLPAGYILSSYIVKPLLKGTPAGIFPGRLLLIGSLSSIVPDLDMAYFYFIDQGKHLHHNYWTHLPVFWTGLAVLVLTIVIARGHCALLPYGLTILIGILSHLLLDTITGGIRWFYPYSNRYFFLFQVPPIHKWWVLNFVLHWTFIIELVLTAVACWIFLNRKGTGKGTQAMTHFTLLEKHRG